MLEISSDDIASLNDEDLRSLVGQLCEAELRAHGISPAAVTWGGNQNAADGGIDVRVALPGQLAHAGFIPRGCTGFQVKKTDFTPAMIEPEMRPSAALRPAIHALVRESGAYIIVSSGANTSDSALKDRIEAMRQTVGSDDPAGGLHLDFYDRSRVATWARNHPGLVLWVRSRIGKAISGWRSYEAWAASPEGVSDVYLMDEKARIHVGTSDEKGIAVTDGIKRIRDALRQPQGVVRLAGLSGVGKTRLVQALFDARVGEGSLDPSLAVYTDMADNPDPQPTGMAHDLIAARKRAIVVVDNCAPDLHRRLTELCHAPESTVSVITVEYDIQEDEPEGTEVFRLEPSTPELVAQLIERRFAAISQVDVHTIAEFSGGNARVALALANTLEKDETLSGFKDEELFRRLFHQRQVHDGSLLAAAQGCALLYSFQGEALSGPAAELPAIASLVGTTAQELFAKVAELKKRDLVQRRGEWRAVLPHAIANRLAVMALKAIPLEIIESQFTTERLMRSFSRRLGFLHESPEAVRVVEKWLSENGLLGNVAALNELGIAMFNNIAPVSPPSTLSSIERALKGTGAEGITGASWRRERAGSLLRSLAYEAELFDRCITALLVLFAGDPPEGRMHTVKDLIVGMFHIYFSGTHAAVEQRARVVDALLHSADARKQALGIELLNATLQTNHFSSGHSFEFGARPRDYGFWPTKRSEIEHWYLAVLDMARAHAFSDLPSANAMRSELAGAFRGLWFVSLAVQDRLEEVTRELLAKEYWQEGWIAVRTILSFPNDKADEASVVRLRALEILLRPKNVTEQVRAIVLSTAHGRLDYADIEEGDEAADKSSMAAYERANAAAEELGKEVAQDSNLLSALLPDLVQGNGGRLTAFGKGLVIGATNREDVWDKLVDALARTPEGVRNVGALCGYLWGLQKVDVAHCEALLEEALEHETLGSWFAVLQTSVPISKEGAERLKHAVAIGKAPVTQFRFLGWGRASDAISGADLKELVLSLAARPQGYAIATDILSMRLHSDRDSKAEHAPELIEAGRELLSQAEFEDRDSMHDYRMRMIVNACLPGKAGKEAARNICKRFKEGLAKHSVYTFHFEGLLEGLFKTQPGIALDVFFGTGNEDGEEIIDVDSFDDPSDRRKNPLDAAPDDIVLNWCAEGGQARYVAIAEAVSFFHAVKDAPLSWTPIALKLLEAAPNPVAVLEVFIERFSPRSWSGSRAVIIESRLHLLDSLNNHANPALAALALQKRPELETEVVKNREWETKRDREQHERFE